MNSDLVSEQIAWLANCGFEQAPGGGLLLHGPALRLRERLVRYLERLVQPYAPARFTAPLFIDRQTLEQAGYLAHFPQQVFAAGSLAEPESRSSLVTPAACLHLYPRLRDRDLAAPFAGFILALCARYESGLWRFPFRLPEFTMAELVVAGEEAAADRLYEQARATLQDGLGALGFDGALRPATDAFFLGGDEGARIIQKLKGLKKEYVVSCLGEEVALASLNRHEDYFARRFGFGPAQGERAASFCLAFGVERLVACGLLLWGTDESGWPAELR